MATEEAVSFHFTLVWEVQTSRRTTNKRPRRGFRGDIVLYSCMDIKYKIKVLEQEVEALRNAWKTSSPPMKMIIHEEAKHKLAEIHILESVLRRRGELKEDKQEKLL